MNNGKICVSVCAETADEFVENIQRAKPLADFIELRFDCLNENEIEKIEYEYAENHIKTFRPKEQGGKRDLSLRKREDFWNSGEDYCGGDFEEDVVGIHNYGLYKPVICSYHNFQEVPENLFDIYERIKFNDANIDVIKIAVQAEDIIDSISIWKLLKKAEKENQPIIPIAMGEAGKWTRILSLAHGAFMTYAALESGKETASGQISAQDMTETYRVRELNAQTKVYGILGNPVSHSLSPYIHNAAFKFHRLNSVFVPFEVKNLDVFIEKFVQQETREIELNFKGFSVTIPHKQTIIKHLDSIDEMAKTIGAVNTVKIVADKLHGFNTDAQGFIEPLMKAYGDLKNAKVAILGSGGAARACLYALKSEDANVTIFARDVEKARSLTKEFRVSLKMLASNVSFDDYDILVNATPLGTKGTLENESAATFEQMKNVRLAYDLVYNPFETRFLREAKKAGVPTIGGFAMLMAQAMAQSKIWTGKDAPMKEMNQIAILKLHD